MAVFHSMWYTIFLLGKIRDITKNYQKKELVLMSEGDKDTDREKEIE